MMRPLVKCSRTSLDWNKHNAIYSISANKLESFDPRSAIFFNSLRRHNYMPNFMTYIFDSNATSKPYTEAYNYRFNTSVFWINAGVAMAIILVLLLIFLFILIFSKICKSTSKLKKYLKNYRYGVFIRFWIQSYLDLGFFCLVQIQSV
jgi:hypothetical protein